MLAPSITYSMRLSISVMKVDGVAAIVNNKIVASRKSPVFNYVILYAIWQGFEYFIAYFKCVSKT